MFDTAATEASNAIARVSPFADAFFVVVIAFLGFMAWRRGEKDNRKEYENHHVERSVYVMLHDGVRALEDIREELKAFNRGQEHTHRLLDAVFNDRQLRPPVLPGHSPKKNGS
jgi:hypothetical protein